VPMATIGLFYVIGFRAAFLWPFGALREPTVPLIRAATAAKLDARPAAVRALAHASFTFCSVVPRRPYSPATRETPTAASAT
jgi:hypothetical protein